MLFQVPSVIMPTLRAAVTPLKPGDLVIFFTDGIRSDFLSEPIPIQSPQLIAKRIRDKYSKGADDALVLVARYASSAALSEIAHT